MNKKSHARTNNYGRSQAAFVRGVRKEAEQKQAEVANNPPAPVTHKNTYRRLLDKLDQDNSRTGKTKKEDSYGDVR